MIHPNLLSIIALLLLLSNSCTYNKQTAENKVTAQKPFFDLESFIILEESRIQKLDSLQKIVTHKGRKERKILPSNTIVSDGDLSVFKKADINRPDWYDKYQVDSSFSNDYLIVSYKAMEQKMPIQLMEVQFYQNNVSAIRIEKNNSSPIADFEQTLLFLPNSSFSISSAQDNLAGQRDSLHIEVNWTNSIANN